MWFKKLVCFDVLNEGGGVPSNDPPRNDSGRPRKITCEFCECELGVSGEYKKLSEKAKAYRDSEEKIENLQAELASVRSELTAAKSALVAATPAPTSAERRTGGGISM